MKCPVCETPTRVYKTRNGRRYRVCPRCGYRLTTVEVAAEYLQALEQVYEQIQARLAIDRRAEYNP
jgi:transcriptional regulator NrdR family protein